MTKKDWLNHWKARLGNPDRTPQQIMHACMEDLVITVARLDEEMEWDCWDNEAAPGYESDNLEAL